MITLIRLLMIRFEISRFVAFCGTSVELTTLNFCQGMHKKFTTLPIVLHK